MLKKQDIILIAILVLLAAGALLLMPTLRKKPSAEAKLFLRYSIQGSAVEEIPLDGERELQVDQGEGIVNVLALHSKGFRMMSSTCHNQLCLHQGEVTVENMEERPLFHMIVCAPHQFVAELVAEEE